MTTPVAENTSDHRVTVRRTRRGGAMHRGMVLTAARDRLDSGGGVLLTGPAGIGRSTMLSQLAAEYDALGHRVLRCSPSESERRLPFLGLIDLLADVVEEISDRLEARQRSALRAALLLGGEPTAGREVLTLRMAVLAVFRVLAALQPVLLVIDDAQWLDAPSLEALAFVAKRVADLPVAAIAAVRSDAATPRAAERICPQPVLAVQVPPMTADEITALLAAQEDPQPPGPLLTHVVQASGGNPFFALELARELAARARSDDGLALDPDGPVPLPVPESLRGLMHDRLAVVSAEARRTLLIAGATARPGLQLLRHAGRERAADHVDEAARAGIVELMLDGSLRFTHPLLAAVAYNEATPEQRLRAHAALAAAVADPVERARHLALVTPGRDADVAAVLSGAATAARRRGAPATAARLGRLAADRTPVEDHATGVDRRLTAAEDAVAAGEHALARAIANDVLSHSRAPGARVRAWNIIVDSCGQAVAEIADVFPQALEDARDDPALLAQLHYRLAWRSWIAAGRAGEAHTHAALSATLAAQAGDRRTEVLALSQQANLEFYLGRAEAEHTLGRALAAPQDPRAMFDHNGPVYLKHRRLLLHDRLDDARTELRALIYTVRQRGAAESLSVCLHSLAQVEVQRGRCERAIDLALQSLRVAEKAGLSLGPSWYGVALAEAAGGSLDRALAAAERARRYSEDDDDLLFLPRALHAEGLIRLLRNETEPAVSALRRVRRLETEQGQGDPAIRRWQADLAEALIRTGAVDEASDLVADSRAQAARLGRRGVLASLDRAAALVAAAKGDLDTAARDLDRAARRLGRLGYPIEEGRTRLALGRLHVRRDDPRPAYGAFAEAQRVFGQAGARPWLSLVAAELERLQLKPAGPREGAWLHTLTATERRVVMLVAQGASNREIAAELVVSVKTVEAALTRTYRKLGVRSRVDVARIAMGAGA